MEIKITGSSKEIKKLFDAISGSKEQPFVDRNYLEEIFNDR